MKATYKRILIIAAVSVIELINSGIQSATSIVVALLLLLAYFALEKEKAIVSALATAYAVVETPLSIIVAIIGIFNKQRTRYYISLVTALVALAFGLYFIEIIMLTYDVSMLRPWVVTIAVVALFFALIRVTRWCKHAYREAMMAFLLMTTNIFAAETGYCGYLLAMVGIGIWFTNDPCKKRRTLDRILLAAAIIITSICSSPLLPEGIRLSAGITIIPVFVIWVKQIFELWSEEYRDFSTGPDIEQTPDGDMRYKRTIDNFFYHICFAIWYAVSSLPMPVLYGISTGLSSLLFYVLRYRRKVVHKNLTDSFPDKSAQEILTIEHEYYLHICDLLVESIKYFSISEEEMRRRLTYKNLEEVRQSSKNGRMVGLYLGHYANWEWVSSLPLVIGDVCICSQLYHPLQNMVFDRLVAYSRERWGGVNIPASESIRHIIRLKQTGKPVAIGFIADQVPLWNNIHYWTPFLNHKDTPVFTGAERLMKKLDMDVYYVDMRKIKRGYYVAEFKPISKTPKETGEFEMTEQYTRMLEQTINEAPPYWLWSHRRWKRTREEFNRLFGNKI